jgi:RNA polymerase-binding protein DksA
MAASAKKAGSARPPDTSGGPGAPRRTATTGSGRTTTLDGPERADGENPPNAVSTTAAAAVEGATMAQTAQSKPTKATKATTAKSAAGNAGRAAAAKRGTRSAADTEEIRGALQERYTELRSEYDQTVADIAELQRDRLTDSAGDDQADTGTKTFEREQEISLANNILERINQVERALERLDEGSYGWCERCGNAIPVERLAAFPSATLCVSCKQLEERR